MNIYPFHYPGIVGIQVHRWQIDLTDHRKLRPLFSVRELGHPCGHHLGHYCLRLGVLRRPATQEPRA